MKNRTAIGIVCIILAVAVTFVVSPFVNKISEQKVEVFRFTKDISQGAQITDADFEIAEILKANVPANAITEKDKVIGKYASTDILIGDYATSARLTADANSASHILGSLNGDKNAKYRLVELYELKDALNDGQIEVKKDGQNEWEEFNVSPDLSLIIRSSLWQELIQFSDFIRKMYNKN